MGRFQNILVRGPNWIGDFVLADDFFAGLRAAFPQSRISLVCPAAMVELARDEIFDHVIPMSRAQRKIPSGISFWRGLKWEKFDCGISLATSLSAAWLLRLSGISERIGYSDWGAGYWLTRTRRWPGRESGKHKAQIYRELLALVTGEAAPVRDSERQALPSETGNAIVLAPGASISLREWPYFVELAAVLRQRYPQTPIQVIGAEAQKNWGARFQALQDAGIENWIGKTTLPEVVELCRKARFVVANDSGVGHLASTLAGAPTVVLFGPGDPDYVTPIGPRVLVARADGVACSPCESAHCRGGLGYQKCLRDLSVDDVMTSIATLN